MIAAGLDPDRYRPLVVLPDPGPLVDDLRADGVEVRVEPLAVVRRALLRPGGLARLGVAWLADAARLATLARRHRVALVHSNTSVTLGGAPAARLAAVPHVWSVHEIYAGFPRGWPAHRRLLLSADVLPCSSEATRAQFDGVRGSDRARVVHEALAIAPERPLRARARSALGLAADAFVVALPGRISSWKGQDVLIRALAAAPLRGLPGAVAVLAGAPWRGQEARIRALRDLAIELGVGDRVRFLGFRDDVENVYAAADVVAVPSTAPDPLPNSALEAAAAGCCVVAADHGGLPEIFADGRTGRLVAPGDPRALAEALAELAADPDARTRLGAAAAVDVRARFAPERLLVQLQELYDEVLTTRAR